MIAVKDRGLDASRGSTDFGEYFVYFSFFLIAGAVLLAGLFFRLGVEQRVREIGTLRALGFASATIRRLFLVEGAVLAGAGALLGAAGAVITVRRGVTPPRRRSPHQASATPPSPWIRHR